MAEGITLAELLAANDEESQRWRSWFERQPASLLDLPTTIAGAGTLRTLIHHIFVTELFFSERVNDLPWSDYETLPKDSVESLFAIGDKARCHFREFIAHMTPEQLAEIRDLGRTGVKGIKASKRKMFLHSMFHSMRHWAQVAVLLRESGHPTDWLRDFVLSKVIE